MSKSEVGGESELERAKEPINAEDPLASPFPSSVRGIQQEIGVSTKIEILNLEETDEFVYTYRCKHCGHEWSEEKTKTTRKKPSKGYVGD